MAGNDRARREAPGRNEPCWCGSGKKYKRCHLSEDREKQQLALELKLAERFVRQDLLEFTQDERFALPFAAALPLYWNEYYTVDNADEMSQNEALRFYDWFAFDYQHEELPARLAEIYHAERADSLSSTQLEVLESWLQAQPAGAYTLTGYESQLLYLREFLTGEEYEAYDPAGRGDAEVGDLILARLLPGNDGLVVGAGAAYIPQGEIGDLADKLETARAADAERHPAATTGEFLRRHNQLLIHHALEKAEESGRPPVSRLQEEYAG